MLKVCPVIAYEKTNFGGQYRQLPILQGKLKHLIKHSRAEKITLAFLAAKLKEATQRPLEASTINIPVRLLCTSTENVKFQIFFTFSATQHKTIYDNLTNTPLTDFFSHVELREFSLVSNHKDLNN